MKNLFLFSALLFSCTLFAQEAVDKISYTGKIGISKIEFNHATLPDGSTAKITTGKSIAIFSNCSEEENAKVQKLCFYNSKTGFNNKRNIKINLPSGAKKLPKTITGTYYVNGEPVNFRLVRTT